MIFSRNHSEAGRVGRILADNRAGITPDYLQKLNQPTDMITPCSRPDRVITYFLEMLEPSALQSSIKPPGLTVSECVVKQFQFNKFLYQFIGERWQWVDKLCWSDEQWQEYVESGSVRTWVAYWSGAVAGYYELVKDSTGDVEIIYFGLAEQFIGKGYGGYLLSEAIRSAWGWRGVKRIWVHTCTLDHPQALQNYLARGMKIYREEHR